MLALSPAATTALAEMLADPEVPEGAGLRLFQQSDDGSGPSLTMAVVDGPAQGDEVLDAGEGVEVFLEPTAAELLADQVLDVEPHGDHVHFAFRDQEPEQG